MNHTVLRKRVAYPANTPQAITLPKGVRRITARLEGRPRGTQVRMAFNERDLVLGRNTFSISPGTPFDLRDVWVPGGKVYFLGQRSRPGVHLRFDIYHVGVDVYGYHRHRLIPDPRTAPESTDLGASWAYAPHARAWMHERLLTEPEKATQCLLGNVSTTFASAEKTTPYLRIHRFISPQGDIPSGATIREIRPSLKAGIIRINDPNSVEDGIQLESLRLIQDWSAETFDYGSDQTLTGYLNIISISASGNELEVENNGFGDNGIIAQAEYSEDASGSIGGLTDGEVYTIHLDPHNSGGTSVSCRVLDAELTGTFSGSGHQFLRVAQAGPKPPAMPDNPPTWQEYYLPDWPLWNQSWTPTQINMGFGLLLAYSMIEYTEEEGALYVALWDAEVNVYYTE